MVNGEFMANYMVNISQLGCFLLGAHQWLYPLVI